MTHYHPYQQPADHARCDRHRERQYGIVSPSTTSNGATLVHLQRRVRRHRREQNNLAVVDEQHHWGKPCRRSEQARRRREHVSVELSSRHG